MIRPRSVLSRLIFVISVCLTILAMACSGGQQESSLEKVVFMAGFKPQANLPFVAAYVAQEKGFFAEENLDVEIRHASSGEQPRRRKSF